MPAIPHDERRPSNWPSLTLLLFALAGWILFRLYLLWANDFPVNDGALFLEFVRAADVAFPRLPTTAAYNGLVLPFSYPPLAFWLGGMVTRLGFDALDVVRVAPILMNIGYVSLFALLLIRSGRSHLFAALAVMFLSVNLASYEWLLMGGGLSRGLGSIFFLLALLSIGMTDGAERRALSLRRMLAAGAAVGLTILSHLEWGLLAAGSVVLSRALDSRSVRDFASSCAIPGMTALALVLPWVLLVGSAHGLQPFLAAGSTSGWSFELLLERLIWVARTAVEANPLVLAGGLGLLLRRQWFWLAFILLCEVLTPRHGPTPIGLAMAVLGAQGILEAYRLAARLLKPGKALTGATAALVAALLVWGGHRSYQEAGRSFTMLSGDAREAMAWVAENHRGSRFAMINDQAWQNDKSGEWFPTLASAQSVTTVQGREWNGQFLHWQEAYGLLRKSGTCAEVKSNMRAFGAHDFIFAETRADCFSYPAHKPVYRNAQVSIFQVMPGKPGT